MRHRRKQKNIALILAGGIGARTKMHIPKQFIVVCGKPIIVHTLERFNRNHQVDSIVVVVLDGWQSVMERYIEEFKLDKVRHLVIGGATGQESIRKGLDLMSKHFDKNDIVLIHDGVRPLVTDEIINANIAGVLLNGNAITIVPATEALLYSEDGMTANKVLDRNTTLRTQTPQSLRLGKLQWLHDEAEKKNIHFSIATCTLLIEMGETVFCASGDTSNFKITTGSDIYLFEAHLVSKGLTGGLKKS